MTKLLTFEEAYETLPSNGWLSRGEALLLWEAASRTDGPILEVGGYCGRSTVLLASTGRQVICVDPFDGFHSEMDGDAIEFLFHQNVGERGLGDQVTLFRQMIEEWQPVPVGFAYLDGDHTYQGTLDQIEKALACDPDGIAVHDVNDSGGGLDVKRAAVEMLGAWDERVERLATWSYYKADM